MNEEKLKGIGFSPMGRNKPYSDMPAYEKGTEANRIIYSAGYLFKPLVINFIKIAPKRFNNLKALKKSAVLPWLP